MIAVKALFLSLCVYLLFFRCVKLDPLPFLEILSLDASEWQYIEITAEIEGIDDFELQETGFVYSTSTTAPIIDDIGVKKVVSPERIFGQRARTFTATLADLPVPPHQYYIRAYIKHNDQYVYSPDTLVKFGDGWMLSNRTLPNGSSFQIVESINGRLYFGLGCGVSQHCQPTKNFWSIDPDGGPSKEEALFDGRPRVRGVSFVLNNMLYFGLGDSENEPTFVDFWRFDFSDADKPWHQIESFPGLPRTGASAFVIGDRAYVGFGSTADNTYLNDLYAFDGNRWLRMNLLESSMPPPARHRALGFSHQDRGYILMGSNDQGNLRDLLEIVPTGESEVSWRRIESDFLPLFRHFPSHIKIRDRTFLGLGEINDSFLSDWYEFSPAEAGLFIKRASLPSQGRSSAGSSDLLNNGYVLGGRIDLRKETIAEIWKYIPDE